MKNKDGQNKTKKYIFPLGLRGEQAIWQELGSREASKLLNRMINVAALFVLQEHMAAHNQKAKTKTPIFSINQTEA